MSVAMGHNVPQPCDSWLLRRLRALEANFARVLLGGALACAVASVLVYPFCAVEIFYTFICIYNIYDIYLYQI